MQRNKPEFIQDIRPVTPSYRGPNSEFDNLPDPELEQPNPPKKKKRWIARIVSTITILFLLVLIPALIVIAMDIKNFTQASGKLFGTSNVLSALPPKQLDTTPESTVHILIAGYSADDPGHGGSTLTDTIMVLSINKTTKKGYMLSIPRDLYVKIPGYGSAKINEVHQDGERAGFNEPGYPTGGTGLLSKVVEDVTGLPIHYTFLINYAAVRDVVNAFGGITVTINNLDPQGVYDPGFKAEEGGALKLPNGNNNIDGQTALNLTRARGLAAGSYGFPQSDFNRAQNQQSVVTGILNEISWRVILDPRENKKLFDAIANNVQTSLAIKELFPFARLLLGVNTSALANYTLRDYSGTNFVNTYRTSSGQSALKPIAGLYNYSDIQAAVRHSELVITE
jgi:polyisoprenyl-teichoic acid--peptidoglycan teichoic acid transferase